MAVVDSESKVKDMYRKRVIAYNNVFNKELPFVVEVLKDLAKFCKANETCFHVDPRAHAVNEGRREVWLRIQQALNLSPEELMQLHSIKQIKTMTPNP